MDSRPNLLFLTIDCLRTDRAFEQGRSALTPNLDGLAERGALFTHMIAVNSYTVPCMASMITGLYPRNHGVRGMATRRLPATVPTLAERFRAAGWHTHAEMCGPLSPTLGFNRGVDDYRTRSAIRDYLDRDWGARLEARLWAGEMHKPWFMSVHLWELHQPRRIPPEFDSPRWGERPYDRALSALDRQLGRLLERLPSDTWLVVTGDHGERLAQSRGDEMVQRYKIPVQRFFKRLGVKRGVQRRITSLRQHALRALGRRGLIKDPLATLVGHGFHVYDYLVRVPFLLVPPRGGFGGVRVTQQVGQVDIVPTLVEIFGLDSGDLAKLDGRSLASCVRGGQVEPRPAYIESTGIGLGDNPQARAIHGVRTDGWKYAYGAFDPTIPEELYDLAVDPVEDHNLAADLPERRSAMRALADEFFKGQASPLSRPETELQPAEVMELKHRLRELGYME